MKALTKVDPAYRDHALTELRDRLCKYARTNCWVTGRGGPRRDGPPGSAGLSGPEPLQQVAVDDLVLRGDHAVRVTLV
jgi:hypothetical protein